MRADGGLKIRRALLSVSDKTGILELARALRASGAELIATGRTAASLTEAGLELTPIEKISGCPEAFQGRMKTLSFPVFSGILYRRGDSEAALKDAADLERLGFGPIDCVVVNFYPFEAAVAAAGELSKTSKPASLIEEIDIGGPALVRAAAKNAPDVLVLTSPAQYEEVIAGLERSKAVDRAIVERSAAEAWNRVLSYDAAIAREFGREPRARHSLRYGENPHQTAYLEFDPDGPVGWGEGLGNANLSYNNILDFSAAYALASDLVELAKGFSRGASGVVVVKHGNPCGVALVPKSADRDPRAQMTALVRAWEGDPVSAFGGVIAFTDPIEEEVAARLSERFIELVAAPGLARESKALQFFLDRRKNIKALSIRRFGELPAEYVTAVPGGRVCQSPDRGTNEPLLPVTQVPWPENKELLARFGIAVCRALKSNAIAIVREDSGFQLVGAGQGQPNRVEALGILAIPRARKTLGDGGTLADCVMVSDAFFPFRDTVDAAHRAGIRYIVQPGGSLKDSESIAACNDYGIAMVFTGVRHFKH
ncbi:MAG: hypothetical protein A2603_03575 [Bdellovibrionales bacterium RIFOXYD1_FULL_55_31]|nr:MAG: hypothetical protein A2603_03575 [Bdellovibrionales bacterium RIFOXYD1_FULL_55_31]